MIKGKIQENWGLVKMNSGENKGEEMLGFTEIVTTMRRNRKRTYESEAKLLQCKYPVEPLKGSAIPPKR